MHEPRWGQRSHRRGGWHRSRAPLGGRSCQRHLQHPGRQLQPQRNKPQASRRHAAVMHMPCVTAHGISGCLQLQKCDVMLEYIMRYSQRHSQVAMKNVDAEATKAHCCGPSTVPRSMGRGSPTVFRVSSSSRMFRACIAYQEVKLLRTGINMTQHRPGSPTVLIAASSSTMFRACVRSPRNQMTDTGYSALAPGKAGQHSEQSRPRRIQLC